MSLAVLTYTRRLERAYRGGRVGSHAPTREMQTRGFGCKTVPKRANVTRRKRAPKRNETVARRRGERPSRSRVAGVMMQSAKRPMHLQPFADKNYTTGGGPRWSGSICTRRGVCAPDNGLRLLGIMHGLAVDVGFGARLQHVERWFPLDECQRCTSLRVFASANQGQSKFD
ncbi:uncharacterized protein LOC101332410 [Anopheles sinensis]|uniref:Uncharacterized protein LOC101332410 n=1 Tax=Anopheles sinensis TaxID=74873 RepID=A0A084WR73_ANOSI|nr:uncharacterized protein LOC101332410 [Anopheles sinensis]